MIFVLDGGVVELGAQWVHGKVNNVVHSLGKSAGLVTDDSIDLYKSQTILSDGSYFNQDLELKLYSLCKEVMNDGTIISTFGGSLGEYIHKRLAGFNDLFLIIGCILLLFIAIYYAIHKPCIYIKKISDHL